MIRRGPVRDPFSTALIKRSSVSKSLHGEAAKPGQWPAFIGWNRDPASSIPSANATSRPGACPFWMVHRSVVCIRLGSRLLLACTQAGRDAARGGRLSHRGIVEGLSYPPPGEPTRRRGTRSGGSPDRGSPFPHRAPDQGWTGLPLKLGKNSSGPLSRDRWNRSMEREEPVYPPH